MTSTATMSHGVFEMCFPLGPADLVVSLPMAQARHDLMTISACLSTPTE